VTVSVAVNEGNQSPAKSSSSSRKDDGVDDQGVKKGSPAKTQPNKADIIKVIHPISVYS
jgi:hypothetical protein